MWVLGRTNPGRFETHVMKYESMKHTWKALSCIQILERRYVGYIDFTNKFLQKSMQLQRNMRGHQSTVVYIPSNDCSSEYNKHNPFV
jgi:hypothetical protein